MTSSNTIIYYKVLPSLMKGWGKLSSNCSHELLYAGCQLSPSSWMVNLLTQKRLWPLGRGGWGGLWPSWQSYSILLFCWEVPVLPQCYLYEQPHRVHKSHRWSRWFNWVPGCCMVRRFWFDSCPQSKVTLPGQRQPVTSLSTNNCRTLISCKQQKREKPFLDKQATHRSAFAKEGVKQLPEKIKQI